MIITHDTNESVDFHINLDARFNVNVEDLAYSLPL